MCACARSSAAGAAAVTLSRTCLILTHERAHLCCGGELARPGIEPGLRVHSGRPNATSRACGERDYLSSISSDDESDSGDEISDDRGVAGAGFDGALVETIDGALAAQRAALVRPADVHEQAALCRTKCSQRAVKKNTGMRRPRASY